MTNSSQPLFRSEAAIASVLAHSVVYFARENAHGVELICGGDPPAPTPSESMDSVLQAYVKNLPQLMQTMGANILPYEQATVAANQQLAPVQNQLALDIARQYGPQFTQVGTEINRLGQLGQAQTDLETLTGPGKQLAAAQLEAQKLADPEYYKSRELALGALGNLFGGLPDSRGGLSGAEREEITRSLARDNAARGNDIPSAATTVENAMRFGAAGEARKAANESRIANAVGAATGAMPAMKSGIDVLNTTTGRPTIMNPGQTQFAGVSKDTGSATKDAGQQMFGAASDMAVNAANINANRRDTLDRITQFQSSLPNVSCCWIFLAAHGGELPWYVRKARDVYGTDATRRGYKRMSTWLVPIMERSAVVRAIVRTIMTDPLSMYAGYLLSEPTCANGWVFAPLKRFWFAVWNRLGEKE